MEENKIKEMIKKIIKIWLIIIGFYSSPILIFGIEKTNEILEVTIQMCIWITLMFAVILLTIVIGNKINYNIFKHRNSKVKMQKYMRDIPKKYSIAVGSIIQDNLLEATVDIPAIVLSLIGKSIFKYESKTKTITAVDTDISKLYGCEKYIYKCIKYKERINYEKFRILAINEALNKGYIKKNNINPNKKGITIIQIIIIIAIVLITSILLSMMIVDIFDGVIGIILVMIIWVSIIVSPIVVIQYQEMNNNNPYINTRSGKKEAHKLEGLKKYLEEFSMLDEKEIRSAILWEDYLAYAYMFRINKKNNEEFEEFLKNSITFF